MNGVSVAGLLLLQLGTWCCSFPHHGVHAAAAGTRAEQAAQLARGKTPLPAAEDPTVDKLVSVGIQRLQQNGTWKLWKWPPAAKEFLNAGDFK